MTQKATLTNLDRAEYGTVIVDLDLLAALEEAKEALEAAQGEWVAVTAAYAPYETHVLKAAVIRIEEAIAKARGQV